MGSEPQWHLFSNPTMTFWLQIPGPAETASAVGASVYFGKKCPGIIKNWPLTLLILGTLGHAAH